MTNSWFVFVFTQKTAYGMLISDWSSDVCSSDLVWPLLDGFFRTEMARQTPIRSAMAAMAAIARHADIVVLTNVGPDHQAARSAQLSAAGLGAPEIGRAACRDRVGQ